MRLTLELLQQAPQSLNPANQRQILLRGQKIPAIENLGGTNDAYECIDFSDNDIIKLSNFPPLKRLRCLMLTNNRISRIAEDCFETIPGVSSVVLTGNKLEKLVDLESLTKLKTLERLSLVENAVTKVKHYRPYMIHKCSKTLRILDFNRIKDKERKAAALLFAGERGAKLLAEIAPPRSAAKDQDAKVAGQEKPSGPSPAVIERIKKAIAEAETIEEVTRLERALKSGILPEDLQDDEDKEDQQKDENDKEDADAMETEEKDGKKEAAKETATKPAENEKEDKKEDVDMENAEDKKNEAKEDDKKEEEKKDAKDAKADYSAMKVVDLKKICKEKGLTQGGVKDELVKRLEEHQEKEMKD